MSAFDAKRYVDESEAAGVPTHIMIDPKGKRCLMRDYSGNYDSDAIPDRPHTKEGERAIVEEVERRGRGIDLRATA